MLNSTVGLVAMITEREQRKLKPERGVEDLLKYLGEDVSRPGVVGTPRRFVKAMEELTRGLREPPPEVVFFPLEYEAEVGPVVIENISAVSICEHHLLPHPPEGVSGIHPRR
jgi:GTP cyclohydrolase I (EC 3.5.4.16)